MAPPAGGDAASILSSNTATSTSRSIYPRGPTFSLDTFSSKDFIVRDFVESLSDGVLSSKRRSGAHAQVFDPKPYIRTFEHALTRIDALSEDRESHENELASAVRRAEGQHRQHCSTLQRKLDQALESFQSLETRLDTSVDNVLTNGYSADSGGVNTALQIGERLEELDRQKRRAEDAKVLLQCWQDVNERGDLTYLEDVRKVGGGEGRIRCAQIARQLLKISTALNSSSGTSQVNGLGLVNGDGEGRDGVTRGRRTKETNEIVEKFLERLEKDLLEQFEQCRKNQDQPAMRDCAKALHDFSDGASVIGRYVNQHDFFLGKSAMAAEEVTSDPEVWNRLADPDADPPGIESSLQSLVDEVKYVLEEESFPIKSIFPFHEQVLATFIQRIFQQSIQQRLELVLDKADAVSSIAFLRSLQAARSYISATIDDLKAHGLTEYPDSTSATISACLDQQLEDLFVPYLTGSSYVDREKRSLEELYGSLLFKFTLYQAKKRKTPTTYLGSLSQRGREILASARDSYIDRLDSTELSASQKAILLRIAGIRDSDRKADIEVTEEDGALSLAVAKRMLQWLAEAVGRGLELSGGSETPKDVAILQRLLLTQMADIYLDSALDSANENAITQEALKTEPDLLFIPESHTAISILHLLHTITHSVLLPLTSPNTTITRDLSKTTQTTLTRLEDKLSALRAHTIDTTLSHVSRLLARQPRSDFRPRDDADVSAGLTQLQTPTCTAIFAFLCKVRDLALSGPDGTANNTAFCTDLATGFRSLLLEHLKKYQVNLAGGLMVSKDLTKYIELMRSLPLAAGFLPSLEVLVEVGNIFVIGAEALKERLRGGGGGALTGVERGDLRPYVARREDAASVGVQAALLAL